MPNKEYSHIVVGAGSAGCVVSARISENPKFHVLLIEAGPDYGADDVKMPPSLQDSRKVPMRGQSEVYDPKVDWNIDISMPDGSTMQVPQGKLIGGGSSINGGTALRHTEADSREWVELGNSEWNFDSCYEIYQSLEKDEMRGTKGPHPIVRVTDNETGKIQRAFVDGCVEYGLERVLDLNVTGSEGAGPSPVCRRGSNRVSLANTFIDPIRRRKNFSILSESAVDRVLFSGTRATGVELANSQIINATHEIVICASAILSPPILQRSGVGPSSPLQKHGIESIVDLPVGLNAYDHPCIPIVARPRPGAYKPDEYSLQCQARFSSSLRPGAIDHQLICFSYLYAQAPDPRVQQRSLAGATSGHVAGIGCNVNKPTSTGTIAIASRDVNELPIVTTNYMQTKNDRASARELVRVGWRVLTSEAMKQAVEEPIGLTQQDVDDDDKLDKFIMSNVTSTYHFCGTNRMASREKGGVVNQSGRVYGVQGLRVADASVCPTVPASNTMWTTVMIGERIGSAIRDGREVGEERREIARL